MNCGPARDADRDVRRRWSRAQFFFLRSWRRMSDQTTPDVPMAPQGLGGLVDGTPARERLFVGGCTVAFLLIAASAAYLVISTLV